MKHYTQAELDMYRHGDMNLLGRIQCAAHLKECPECIQKLEELKVDDELILQLQASVDLFQAFSDHSKTPPFPFAKQ